MPVTIRDVARSARVSIATVSRVINRSSPVSAEKRRRVEAAIEELGYRPNPAARTLLKQETGGLGVLLPFVWGDFFSELLIGIDGAARQAGYYLLISAWHRNQKTFAAAMKGLDRRVDGLLVMATEMTAEEVAEMLPPDLPLVFVNTRTTTATQDVLNFDNYGGVFQGTQHLVALGHRRIVFITGPMKAYDAQERLKGYRDALSACGIAYEPCLVIEGAYSQEAGYAAAPAVLMLDPLPTAVISSNDYCAIGLLAGLREAGVCVPDDLSVVGFDDVPSARYITPRLSSLRVPIRKIGVEAMKRLIRHIEEPDGWKPEQRVVPVLPVLRDSSRAVEHVSG